MSFPISNSGVLDHSRFWYLILYLRVREFLCTAFPIHDLLKNSCVQLEELPPLG